MLRMCLWPAKIRDLRAGVNKRNNKSYLTKRSVRPITTTYRTRVCFPVMASLFGYCQLQQNYELDRCNESCFFVDVSATHNPSNHLPLGSGAPSRSLAADHFKSTVPTRRGNSIPVATFQKLYSHTAMSTRSAFCGGIRLDRKFNVFQQKVPSKSPRDIPEFFSRVLIDGLGMQGTC
jgi:hypothetical protein